MRTDEAAWLNSLFWSTFTLGRMLMTPIAACLSAQWLLLPTLSLEVAASLLVICEPSSPQLLWAGTACAGLGVCGLWSNVISLLAQYDLLSARTTSAMSAAAAVGHMTLPNLTGIAIQHTALQYDALIWLVGGASLVGLILTSIVVVHLGRNFTPVTALAGPSCGRWRSSRRQPEAAFVHVHEELELSQTAQTFSV